MDYTLQKQAAQRVGSYSETVEIETVGGRNRFDFPQVSKQLNKCTVIGIEVAAGDGSMKSAKSGKVLLTKAEISTGRLHLENINRDILELPLRMFILDTKPLVYVPIEPLKNFNPSQCHVYFAEQFTGEDIGKVIEINIITE